MEEKEAESRIGGHHGESKRRKEALLTRNQYNALKRMDRTDAEDFAKNLYQQGYAKGCVETEARLQNEIEQAGAAERALLLEVFRGKLLRFLTTVRIPGIGTTTLAKIANTVNEWRGES